jgi:hypothetical protein
MRDQLIGYLLDALEPSEHELVEARLSHDPQLRRDLQLAARGLEPLAADKAHYEAPVGLAERTCQFVTVKTHVTAQPVTSVPSRWSMADLAMAAGIFLAATLLFWPAMNQSRFAARLAGCQNNLRQIGVGMAGYSTIYHGQFPAPALSGNTNWAGMYAVILREQGLLPGTHILICPSSELAERPGDLRVPSPQELLAAHAEQLGRLRKTVGGSYGYSLGFFVNGRYHSPQDMRRATHALMADAPSPTTPLRHSLNHGGCGQNVLFEDLHVQFLATCKAKGCRDHIFVNDDGQPYAGLHLGDAVIGASDDCPLVAPIAIESAPSAP